MGEIYVRRGNQVGGNLFLEMTPEKKIGWKKYRHQATIMLDHKRTVKKDKLTMTANDEEMQNNCRKERIQITDDQKFSRKRRTRFAFGI